MGIYGMVYLRAMLVTETTFGTWTTADGTDGGSNRSLARAGARGSARQVYSSMCAGVMSGRGKRSPVAAIQSARRRWQQSWSTGPPEGPKATINQLASTHWKASE